MQTYPPAYSYRQPSGEVTPLAPDRYRLQCTIDGATLEKLRLAKDMLRHAVPSGDDAVILDRAFTALLADLARSKFAAVENPQPPRAASPDSRHVPAEVKRAVWVRDLGRCAFVGTDGRRCNERAFVEFHHVRPYAAGGEATVENIQLRCRRHNGYEARLFFDRGREDEGVGDPRWEAEDGGHRRREAEGGGDRGREPEDGGNPGREAEGGPNREREAAGWDDRSPGTDGGSVLREPPAPYSREEMPASRAGRLASNRVRMSGSSGSNYRLSRGKRARAIEDAARQSKTEARARAVEACLSGPPGAPGRFIAAGGAERAAPTSSDRREARGSRPPPRGG